MKKFLVVMLCLLSACFCLTACGGKEDYTVNLVVDNETYATIKADDNSKIALPSMPTKDGYILDGWYCDNSFEKKFNLDIELTENTTIYAKWEVAFIREGNTITGIIEAAKLVSDLVIPNVLDGIEITAISDEVFMNCSKLTNITIPKSVTSIGEYAFYNCGALQTVTFENDSECTNIGDSSFGYCSNLTGITIPSNVEDIAACAFHECTALQTVIFENNSKCKKIGDSALRELPNLTSIVIPSSVRSVGFCTFYNCLKLTKVFIDASSIAGLVSSDSQMLTHATTVYVKDTITTVGAYITDSFSKQEDTPQTEGYVAGYIRYTKKP